MMCDPWRPAADLRMGGPDNLAREGHSGRPIQFVGNVLMDTIRNMLPRSPAKYTLRQFNPELGSAQRCERLRPDLILKAAGGATDTQQLNELAHLNNIRRDLPLVWVDQSARSCPHQPP